MSVTVAWRRRCDCLTASVRLIGKCRCPHERQQIEERRRLASPSISLRTALRSIAQSTHEAMRAACDRRRWRARRRVCRQASQVELGVIVVRLAVHLRAQARDDVVEAARRNRGCRGTSCVPARAPSRFCRASPASEPNPYQTGRLHERRGVVLDDDDASNHCERRGEDAGVAGTALRRRSGQSTMRRRRAT